MAARTITEITIQIIHVACASCSMPIAMQPGQESKYRQNGATFYCFQGHQNFFGDNENDRLRKKLTQAQDQIASLETDKRNLDGLIQAEGKRRKRLGRRAVAGVCPHCHRTFQQVARHMKTKHPEILYEAMKVGKPNG